MKMTLLVLCCAAGAALAETPQDHADSLGDIAGIYMRNQQWDRAVQVLDEALLLRPKDPDLFGDLVTACMHAASCEKRRLALIRQGVEAFPENAGDLLESLVRELVREGQAARVVPELRAYVQRHPSDDDARELLIENAADRGAPDVALKELAIYLAHRPNDVEKRALEVELLQQVHRERAAKEALRSLAKSHPADATVLCLRGQRLLDQGRIAAAEKELWHARAVADKNNPDEKEAIDELATEIARTKESHYAEFRLEASWLDDAEDLQREQDREP